MNFKLTAKEQSIINEIVQLLDKSAELYIVGGYIRDKILNKENFDMDFIIKNQNAIELAKQFANTTNRYFVILDEQYEIARVIDKDKLHYFDFARCENDNINSDLNRRDLTINAIALKVYPYIEEMDLHNGIIDMQNKIVRIINEQNIIDDPLRILRIFRFASVLDYEIDKETLFFAQKHAFLINNVAKERILAEFIKTFEGNNSAKTINLMKDSGLLYKIFDILHLEEEVPPNTHHHLKLIDHSIETIRQVEILLKNAPAFVKEKIYSYQANGIKYCSLLKISCLLHDVGKHSTWTIEENGRHRFINHDSVGAELLKPILKEMKFSKPQIKYITTLVRNHIYPSQLARENEIATDKATNKMFRKLGEYTIDTLLLAMADRLSAQGPAITKEITENNISTLKNYINLYHKFSQTEKPLPKLLDGNEISQILNIPKDKFLGKIINKLKEAQLAGEVNNKEEALEFIKSVKKL